MPWNSEDTASTSFFGSSKKLFHCIISQQSLTNNHPIMPLLRPSISCCVLRSLSGTCVTQSSHGQGQTEVRTCVLGLEWITGGVSVWREICVNIYCMSFRFSSKLKVVFPVNDIRWCIDGACLLLVPTYHFPLGDVCSAIHELFRNRMYCWQEYIPLVQRYQEKNKKKKVKLAAAANW